nr:hypothetical protein [Cytobacillus praedii]
MEVGTSTPAGKGLPGAGAKLPAPLPSRTDTLSVIWFDTATSIFPSPLKSAAVIVVPAVPPVGKGLPGAGAKLPAPLPSRTDTLLEAWFSTARSIIPFPLKSAAVMEFGKDPPVRKGLPGAGAKPPVPLPRKTETLLELAFDTAKSICPSPSKSAAMMEEGPNPPVGKGLPSTGAKPPVPSPSRIDTLKVLKFATARSIFPSSLKSAVMMETGVSPPVGKGLPGASTKPPVPLPNRIDTLSELKFATARSIFPSTSKSAAVMDLGLTPSIGKVAELKDGQGIIKTPPEFHIKKIYSRRVENLSFTFKFIFYVSIYKSIKYSSSSLESTFIMSHYHMSLNLIRLGLLSMSQLNCADKEHNGNITMH